MTLARQLPAPGTSSNQRCTNVHGACWRRQGGRLATSPGARGAGCGVHASLAHRSARGMAATQLGLEPSRPLRHRGSPEPVAGCHCSPCAGRLPCSVLERKHAADSGARKSRGRSHRRRPCRQARRQKEPDFPDSIVRTLTDKDLRAKRTFRRTMTWTQCSSTAP